MHLLDLSLASPAENLACDEALLDWAEAESGRETLRFWTTDQTFVVIGYGNARAQEVHLAACEADKIPVLRRCSGGGTVLQGPGCLNYALILAIESPPELHSIPSANRFIMERHRDALTAVLGRPVQVRGHTDLTLDDRKFSGNSQRRRRRCLLFHGTFLLGLDPERVERYLAKPSREPEYRRQRSHTAFLTELPLTVDQIRAALIQTWQADLPLDDWPKDEVERLTCEKYSRKEWNDQR